MCAAVELSIHDLRKAEESNPMVVVVVMKSKRTNGLSLWSLMSPDFTSIQRFTEELAALAVI